MTPEKALKRLIEGNQRYVNNKSSHPNRNKERREAISSEQSPFAIIVGCSDSRVSPEIIFDEGLGDLFVVRVAGNVIGPIELESIGFAALFLHSSIILVLGHENCGAVEAVIENNIDNIGTIAKFIKPAIEKDNNLELSIKKNALNMKLVLEKSSSIEKLIKDKKIAVHAAYYNLKTGLVKFLNN